MPQLNKKTFKYEAAKKGEKSTKARYREIVNNCIQKPKNAQMKNFEKDYS